MANALNPNEIDISKITFSSPKTLENGGKMIYLNYESGINSLYVVTPEGTIPFDPNYFADDNKDESSSKSGKYSMTMSLNKELKGMEDFTNVFTNLDEHIMKVAKENSALWFKKPKITMDTLRELYTPMVKISVSSETGEPNNYPPKFAWKVVKRDGKFQNFQVYDNNKVVFDVDKVTDNPSNFSDIVMKGTKIKAVLKCNGIWVANGKFGCTWKAEQMRVKLPEGGLRDFAILSDSDDENENENENDNENDNEIKNMIEDSDEEQEDKPEPTPPVETKKKGRRIKVKTNKNA